MLGLNTVELFLECVKAFTKKEHTHCTHNGVIGQPNRHFLFALELNRAVFDQTNVSLDALSVSRQHTLKKKNIMSLRPIVSEALQMQMQMYDTIETATFNKDAFRTTKKNCTSRHNRVKIIVNQCILRLNAE